MQKHIIYFSEQAVIIHEDRWWFNEGQAEVWADLNPALIQVGEIEGAQYYVANISPLAGSLEKYSMSLKAFRELIAELDDASVAILSRASQLLHWRKTHQFCGQCGCRTTFDSTENSFSCEACSLHFYPRISPCIMCLVVKGDYCLLAHHTRHKSGVYSTLAGFVEAGETLEQAIQREVKEEVNLDLGEIEYLSSQTWPFPHQLMVGYLAEYESGEIQEDQLEIKDAQWFRYDQLPKLPPKHTLSMRLIETFVKRREAKNQS